MEHPHPSKQNVVHYKIALKNYQLAQKAWEKHKQTKREDDFNAFAYYNEQASKKFAEHKELKTEKQMGEDTFGKALMENQRIITEHRTSVKKSKDQSRQERQKTSSNVVLKSDRNHHPVGKKTNTSGKLLVDETQTPSVSKNLPKTNHPHGSCGWKTATIVLLVVGCFFIGMWLASWGGLPLTALPLSNVDISP